MAKQDDIVFDPPITGGVVVGHDGSAASAAAVAFAADEARLRGLPLHLVRAWKLSNAMAETAVPFGTVPSWQECIDAVDGSLATVSEGLDLDGVDVHRHVQHGGGARVLLAAATEADLLVVGERGIGGFAGLVLGSVAEQAVRHAPCTVIVVRAR